MEWSKFIFSFALAIIFIPCITVANESLTPATEIVQKAKQDCNDFENGMFHSTEKAITLHDITGDGQPETFVDTAKFSCSTALTLWDGSGGTYLWVIIDDKAYEFLAHKWKVFDVDGQIGEAFAKGLFVLLRQHGGGHQDGHLVAGIDRPKRRPHS